MRHSPPSKKILTYKAGAVFLFLCWGLPCRDAAAAGLPEKIRESWARVRSYQCVYRTQTAHEGQRSETRMLYSFQKPKKIRMDIEKPRKGAVLIYNPETSEKVRIRPFPALSVMVVSYALTDKRVTSDSGGTIDRSDLGSRMEAFLLDFEKLDPSARSEAEKRLSEKDPDLRYVDIPEKEGGRTRYYFDDGFILNRKESLDAGGGVTEFFEWTDLKLNPEFPGEFFKKF